MTPAEIVRGIESGDAAAERELYELMRGGTRWLAARALATNPDEIEDCVQQISLTVLTAVRAGTLREPDKLLSFVRTIAKHVIAQVIERLVRARKLEPVEWSTPVVGPNIERDLIEQERRELMVRTLERMLPREREILTRFYLDEQPWEQICAEMRLSETQFRLAKCRAKAKFADVAGREYSRRGLPKAA